ncbi:PepSY domain-containing protein [Zhongshania aliphaticivorans]|nr:PepSY domain-containing protein [Zhongshania aliphaticivorans]
MILLLILVSITSYSEANPLGNLTGGRLNLPDRPQLEQNKRSLSVNEAISIAERRYGGRAVGAKKIRGSNAYSVRILQDNGKIKNVTINN